MVLQVCGWAVRSPSSPVPSVGWPGPGLDKLPTVHPLGLSSTRPRGFVCVLRSSLMILLCRWNVLVFQLCLGFIPLDLWMEREANEDPISPPGSRLSQLLCAASGETWIPFQRLLQIPQGGLLSPFVLLILKWDGFVPMVMAISSVKRDFWCSQQRGGRCWHLMGRGHNALIVPHCSGQSPPQGLIWSKHHKRQGSRTLLYFYDLTYPTEVSLRGWLKKKRAHVICAEPFVFSTRFFAQEPSGLGSVWMQIHVGTLYLKCTRGLFGITMTCFWNNLLEIFTYFSPI